MEGQILTGRKQYLGVALIVVILLFAWFTQPAMLQFSKSSQQNLLNIFAYLVLISIFVERVTDVFLSTWRSEKADKLDRIISNLKEKLSDTENETTSSNAELVLKTKKDLELKIFKRVEYRAESRFIAQRLSLLIGVIVSFLGVRILDSLLESSSLLGSQLSVFIITDILFTGATIAGGSDSINKIMKLYSSVIDNTTNKSKE